MAAATIKAMLKAGQFIAAPGVFDMVSAKIAARTNARALYMTGFGTVASYLGYPDAGLATYTDMVNRAAAGFAVAPSKRPPSPDLPRPRLSTGLLGFNFAPKHNKWMIHNKIIFKDFAQVEGKI